MRPDQFKDGQLSFQFHKGTIRTFHISDRLILSLGHFNSIKVRLERLDITTTATPKGTFQFHKGTIRTRQRKT